MAKKVRKPKTLQPQERGLFSQSKNKWAIALLLGGIGGQTVLEHFQQSTAGLVLAIALIVIAVLLVLDAKHLSFLRAIFWNRSNMALIVFAVFEIVAVIFFNQYVQNIREQYHPKLVMEKAMVGRILDAETKHVRFTIELYFTNRGTRSAYGFQMTQAMATIELLKQAQLLPDKEVGGIIGAGETIVVPVEITVASSDGISIDTFTEGIAYYWDAKYYGSAKKEENDSFHNEQWAIIWSNDSTKRLAFLPEEYKAEFKFYVDRLIGR